MTNFRFALKVLSEKKTDFGFVIRTEIWPGFSYTVSNPYGDEGESKDVDEIVENLKEFSDEVGRPSKMTTCYTLSGDWIGDVDTAKYLCEEKGIAPVHPVPIPKGALRPCSIGFCERDQKWYGWSHRAISGFGILSVVKRGDCAYQPTDRDDFGRKMLAFFVGNDSNYLNCSFRHTVNADGVSGVEINATYSETVPNQRLRGSPYVLFRPYPEKFGRGLWVAETLEDARQMAVDFAESVS